MYRKNAWKKYEDKAPVMDFAEGYKKFITYGKTERLVVKESVELLEKAGFVDGSKAKLIKPGDKLYFLNKNKNVAAFIIGKKPLSEGLRILGAHIDSPRLDLKENPVYENNGFALGDTHYYGGVKKYQWVTVVRHRFLLAKRQIKLRFRQIVFKKRAVCGPFLVPTRPATA